MTNLLPDPMHTLFQEMRSLLEEIIADETRITAVSFQVVYLSADQVARIQRALRAGEQLSISPAAEEA